MEANLLPFEGQYNKIQIYAFSYTSVISKINMNPSTWKLPWLEINRNFHNKIQSKLTVESCSSNASFPPAEYPLTHVIVLQLIKFVQPIIYYMN